MAAADATLAHPHTPPLHTTSTSAARLDTNFPLVSSPKVLGAAVVVSPFVIGYVNYKGSASSAASSVMSALDKVKSPISSTIEQDSEYDSQLAFIASNEYTALQGYAGKDYPWIEEGQLVEPHKTTTFTSTSTLKQSVLARMNLAWSVDGGDEETTGTFKYVFEQPGTYTVKMAAYDKGSGDLVASTTKQVISKYVRREIRTLSDDDREAFFSAAEVMYKTELGDGKKVSWGPHHLVPSHPIPTHPHRLHYPHYPHRPDPTRLTPRPTPTRRTARTSLTCSGSRSSTTLSPARASATTFTTAWGSCRSTRRSPSCSRRSFSWSTRW